MCLIVEADTLFKVLRKPLIVYKEMYSQGNNFISTYRKYEYIPDVVQKTIELSRTENLRNVLAADGQVTAFYGISKVLDYKLTKGELIAFREGYHFYKTKKRVHKGPFNVVVKCEIPAGSTVIFDKTGLGIASSIMIIGQI